MTGGFGRGRTTADVERGANNTVRRPQSINTPFVVRLLDHLHDNGFDGAPEWCGVDELGREVWTYIDGDVPADLGWHDDAALVAAVKLIRRFHDCAAPLLEAAAAQHAGLETVCHNDLSPCNFVFRDGLPVAIIDWDSAAPGRRVFDLGYAAWLWLDLGNDDILLAEQRRRLALFVDAYGDVLVPELVEAVLWRQQIAALDPRHGRADVNAWAAACLAWTEQHLAAG